MQKDTLNFHLAPSTILTTPMQGWDFEVSDAFSKKFIHSLGLKAQSGCWSEIDLDSPVINDFLDKAGALIDEGKAVFYGSNQLIQQLIDDDIIPWEWYEL